MRLLVIALCILGGTAVTAAAATVAVGSARRILEARLQATGAELRRLADASVSRDHAVSEARNELSAVRSVLEEFRAREQERRGREEQGWATLHRLGAVLSGGQRSGRAGENVVRESLAHLPPSMVVTDFRVNGRVVEFGLVLPDGRTLPVDSKWPAGRELETLAVERDPPTRERLVKAIERTVLDRAREVATYLDPAVTAPVGVAAIPDAAYHVLRKAHADAYRQGVVVVSYSMALPVLLFLHAIVARFGTIGDVQACLTALGSMLDAMESTLENKVARASVMLANGTEELRGQVGKARSSLARARRPAPEDVGVAAVDQASGAWRGSERPEDLEGWEVIGLRS